MLGIMGKKTSHHLFQYGQLVFVLGFRVLGIMGKSTSRHLSQYGQLCLWFSCARNYG